MSMVFRFCLSLVMAFGVAFNMTAQPTQGHLHIGKYPTELLPGLIGEANRNAGMPASVVPLIKIGSIYFRKATVSPSLRDSSLLYGRRAMVLAKMTSDWRNYGEASLLVCKSYLEKDDLPAAEQVLTETQGELHIRLLLAMSEYFVNKKTSNTRFVDQALPFLQRAKGLSEDLNTTHWKIETSIVQAKYHFRKGQISKARNGFEQVINHFRKEGNLERVAHWYKELGYNLPDVDSTYDLQINSFRAAREIYHRLGNVALESELMRAEAYVHTLHDRHDLAEALYLSSQSLLKSQQHKDLWRSSFDLSEFYQDLGSFSKALMYAIEARNELEKTGDRLHLYQAYHALGNIYQALGDSENSIKYYDKFLTSVPNQTKWIFHVARSLMNEHVKIGKTVHGLKSFRAFLAENPPREAGQKQYVAATFGDAYLALGQFRRAEQYYKDMLRINEEQLASNRFALDVIIKIVGAETYLTMARFYTIRKAFYQAHHFSSKALIAQNLTPNQEREARMLLFKADSATGKYISSIHHFQRYIFLKDSIENASTKQEFAFLKLQFQNAQKENDIRMLRQQTLLKDRQLLLAVRTKKFTYFGIAGLVLLLAVIVNRYRIKQLKNSQLEHQKRVIDEKNESLLELVSEKEWLLKEIHHRVKNNLQMVVSLLNSQSSFLKDPAAMNAITNSKLRIQAVSMLHQRLYQTTDMVSVSMPAYIHELVQDLESSLNVDKLILFNLDVDDIELEMSQAVPVGLILNEAITNALKYAFPDRQEGEVNVIFSKIFEDKLLLSISDNGIGLPEGFDSVNTSSFGLRLIRGLSGDLAGDFNLINDNGTALMIEFDLRHSLKAHAVKKSLEGS